jgi:hypothetical protein
MKFILILIAFISFNTSLAQQKPLTKEQATYQVVKIAKSIHRSFDSKKHRNVSTHFEFNEIAATKAKIQNQLDAAVSLKEADLNLIITCAESNNCLVATIDVSSDFHGGYGIHLFWVLIDLNTRQKTIIEQLIYSE